VHKAQLVQPAHEAQRGRMALQARKDNQAKTVKTAHQDSLAPTDAS
jgi:hypothetical protein